LDWGYADQPPLAPLLVQLQVSVFGDSVVAIRILPALLAGLSVLLVGLIAAELGGRRPAQLLAAVSAAVSPVLFAYGHTMSPGSLDIPVWLALGWLAIRLLRTADPRLWVPFGVIAGIGLQAKNLVALMVLGLLAGMLLAGPRDRLRSKYFVFGAGIAVVIALPNVIWQAANGWPQFTMAGSLTAADPMQARIAFLPGLLLILGPLLAPLWIAGLVSLLRGRRWPLYRSIGVATVLVSVVLLLFAGQSRYLTGLSLMLLAAGAVVVVEWWRSAVRRTLVVAAVTVNAVFATVIALPVLSPASYEGDSPLAGLGGDFQLQQTGWQPFAERVKSQYASLPDRDRAVVLTDNYGEAAALQRYAPELPVYSGHNSYTDFGRPAEDKTVVLAIGMNAAYFEPHFSTCAAVPGEARSANPWIASTAWICRGPRGSWQEIWPKLAYLGDRMQTPDAM
jgi:4-amino-4-deoxy-L-arabinose transferase-like glycosyltransferase